MMSHDGEIYRLVTQQSEAAAALKDVRAAAAAVLAALDADRERDIEEAVQASEDDLQVDFGRQLGAVRAEHARAIAVIAAEHAEKLRRREGELENLHSLQLEEMEDSHSTEMQQQLQMATTRHEAQVAQLEKRIGDLAEALDNEQRRARGLQTTKTQLESTIETMKREHERAMAAAVEELQQRHRAEMEEQLLKAKWGLSSGSTSLFGDSGLAPATHDGPMSTVQLDDARDELKALKASSAIERRRLEAETNELRTLLERERARTGELSTRLGIVSCDGGALEQSARTCLGNVTTNFEHLVNALPTQLGQARALLGGHIAP